jgi:stress-induced morphogen
MQAGQRAAIAYIAGRLVTGVDARSVFDRAARETKRYSGAVSEHQVDIFDYQRQHHVAGDVIGDTVELYDYASDTHLLCRLAGNQFMGLDQASRHRYAGWVQGSRISLYDAETRARYDYDLR